VTSCRSTTGEVGVGFNCWVSLRSTQPTRYLQALTLRYLRANGIVKYVLPNPRKLPPTLRSSTPLYRPLQRRLPCNLIMSRSHQSAPTNAQQYPDIRLGKKDRTTPTSRSARTARSFPRRFPPDGSRRRHIWSRDYPASIPASGGGGWRWRRSAGWSENATASRRARP